MTHELVSILAATPRALAHLVAEFPETALDVPPAGAAGRGEDSGWPARTVLAHLRDDEVLCMRLALERMLAEDEPVLSMLEGGDWADGRNRSRDRKEQLLGDFALQRQASVAILAGLDPTRWDRRGHFGPTRLSLTVRDFAGRWADHDREHLHQLEELLGTTAEAERARRQRLARQG